MLNLAINTQKLEFPNVQILRNENKMTCEYAFPLQCAFSASKINPQSLQGCTCTCT